MQHATSHITQPAQAARRRRRPRVLRPVSPAAVVVTVSLLIGGTGIAGAATGGAFILGKANKETSTAALANSKGTPLALSAPARKAPLAVNRNVMVKNLNAQYLGGLTATRLAVTGGEASRGDRWLWPPVLPDRKICVRELSVDAYLKIAIGRTRSTACVASRPPWSVICLCPDAAGSSPALADGGTLSAPACADSPGRVGFCRVRGPPEVGCPGGHAGTRTTEGVYLPAGSHRHDHRSLRGLR